MRTAEEKEMQESQQFQIKQSMKF